jgi:hypothetical protein
MKESSAFRRWSLAVALAATVAAAGWVGGNQEGSRVALVATGEDARLAQAGTPDAQAGAATRDADNPAIELEKLKQRPVATDFGEMFPARQPPPAAAVVKPAPPRAPPLPFQFFGRMVENGTTMVFLNRQDDVFAVKAGDTIGNTYRVEEINGSEIVLTYLPLKQRQALPIGSIQ